MSNHTSAPPVIEDYDVKRGGRVLAFQCPKCGEALRADVSDGGRDEQCPRCAFAFRVPAHREPPKPDTPAKNNAPWHKRDVFGRPSKPKLNPMPTPSPVRTVQRESPPYHAIQLAAGVLQVVAMLGAIAAVIAGVVAMDQVSGWLGVGIIAGGIINTAWLLLLSVCLEAFRDLVMATKRIDDRMSRSA